MRAIRLLPARRPVLLALTFFVAGIISATVVLGAVYGQQAQPAGLTFTADAGLIFNIIKPDQTAAYEAAIKKLQESFAKIEDPIKKQMAAGWTIYKQVEPGQNGSVIYVSIINPVIKDADYSVMKIIADVFPVEAQEIYKSYSAAFVSLGKSNLVKVAEFK